jgi:hypothetical protein
LAALSIDVFDGVFGDDAMSREVFESIKAFRRTASAWSADADLAFLKARALSPPWSLSGSW